MIVVSWNFSLLAHLMTADMFTTNALREREKEREQEDI